MEQSHIDSPSDLIYLFLDGEASGAQQAVLFQRLAKDDELQTEFAEALRIRAATELERAETRPPSTLTADLFRQAGFAPPVPSLPGAPAPASLGWHLGSTLATWTGLALAAVTGALVTALILFGVQDRRVGRLEDRLAQLASQTRAIPQARAAGAREAEATSRYDGPLAEDGRGALPGGSSSAGSGSRRGGRNEGHVAVGITKPSGLDETSTTPIAPTAPANLPSTRDPRIDSSHGVARPSSDAASIWTETDTTTAVASALVALGDGSAATEPAITEISAPISGGRFTAALRSRGELASWPRQRAPAGGPWFNNMSLSLLYRISDELGLGLEGGQEDFPHYDLTNGGEVYHPRIVWGGVALDYTPAAAILVDALRPSMHALVGITPLGPVGKGSLGLAFTPERRITLTAGAEATAFLYSRQGMLFSARNAGITLGMAVHF